MTAAKRRKMGALGLLPDREHLRDQKNFKASAIDHGIPLPKDGQHDKHYAEAYKKTMEYPSAWKVVEKKNEFRLKFDPKRIQEIHNAGVQGRKKDAKKGILEKDNHPTPYIPSGQDNSAKDEYTHETLNY